MKPYYRLIAWITALCMILVLTAGCGQAKENAGAASPGEMQSAAPAPVQTPAATAEPTSKPVPTPASIPEPASPPAPRDVSKDLLLVVDFQNIYLPGYDWACPSMPEAMQNTMRILDDENAPNCVMTKYIAPAEPEGRWKQYNEAYREINENAFLAEFPEELAPYAEKSTVIEKSTYSSLDAPEVVTALEGKSAVVLCGVVADCCVLATMMDAIDLGYEVVYLYDCIAGVSEESEVEIRALAEIYSPIHTTIMSSDEYLSAIAAGRETTNDPPAPMSGGASAEEKNGEIYILFTSDVHCGIDKGFGYAGLKQIRDSLEAQGYTTILVDDGDSVQGESIGMMTQGAASIALMNALGYDAAIPGNHEFDYGMERFLELADMAEFPYISCNFTYLDEPVFDPYVILEAAGHKIAFVGVTTPETISSAAPATFMNDTGEYVYGFLRDGTGEAVYTAVQSAVDDARSQGAELVYVMGHMGMALSCAPWTYADVIEHTNGIDVFLDGHSHDTEQVVMRNKDGKNVTRSAVGTKLACIGYSHISADGEILETGIWTWPNEIPAPELLAIDNDIADAVASTLEEAEALNAQVVAHSLVALRMCDPEITTSEGFPLRLVRLTETNLGDFCADVIRFVTGADLALICGGEIRADLNRGDITYGDILTVWPFGNEICIIRATGQQILDALEWGARALPGEVAAFQQVSGLNFEIDVSVPSGCVADENNQMIGITGPRRVKNVTIGGEPLDPERLYTVGGTNWTLLQNGDGYTAFDGAEIISESVGLDTQIMVDYLTDTLGGVVDEEYSDLYGQGRIVIVGG